MYRIPVIRVAVLIAIFGLIFSAPAAAARGPRPANDDQAAAISVNVLPFSSTVDGSRITRVAGDPGPYCFNGGTVWYSFSNLDRRMVTVSTIGSEVPAGIEVYRQSDSGLQLITCAYDFMTVASAFQAEPSTTYLVMAGPTSASATRGTIKISVDTYGTPPAHDPKAGALDINPESTLDSDSTAGTTDSDDFQACGPSGATMWHRFVPSGDGRYRASVNTEGYFPMLTVGEQTSGGIVPLGCVSASDSPTFFDVRAGRSYYLLVGNATGSQGGLYHLTLAAAPRIVPTVTIDGAGSIDRAVGAAVISGLVSCSEAADFALGVFVSQRDVQGSVFPADRISCGPAPVRWNATVVPGAGAFGPGPADVLAGGTAFTQFDHGSAETSASVTLRSR